MKLAVLGCGAVTVRSHLPALALIPEARVEAVVDPALGRAEEAADRFGIRTAAADYASVIDDIDGAILALPHHLHHPIGVDLLQRGKHVFMEKPLALNVAEADDLISASKRSGKILAVGMARRWLRSARFGKAVIDGGLLGIPRKITVREGAVYGWPVASDFFFNKEKSGGGVLMDTGVHVLDTLIWWFGDPVVINYKDDAAGGIEAECNAVLSFGDIRCDLVLSRIRGLSNTIIVEGSKGTLEVSLVGNQARVIPGASVTALCGEVAELTGNGKSQTTIDLFVAQIRDWIEAILTGGEPIVNSLEARRSISIIEACYANKRYQPAPWLGENYCGAEG